MRKLVRLFFAIIFVCGSTSFIHPLKMSSVTFSYSEKDKTLHIENRFFADDFQKCLNKEFNQRYNLILFYNTKEIRGVVDHFVNRYIQIKLNSKIFPFTCYKAEYNEDANLFHFFYVFPGARLQKNNNLEIEDKMLLAYFPDQKNILILTIPNTKEKVEELDSKRISASFKF